MTLCFVRKCCSTVISSTSVSATMLEWAARVVDKNSGSLAVNTERLFVDQCRTERTISSSVCIGGSAKSIVVRGNYLVYPIFRFKQFLSLHLYPTCAYAERVALTIFTGPWHFCRSGGSSRTLRSTFEKFILILRHLLSWVAKCQSFLCLSRQKCLPLHPYQHFYFEAGFRFISFFSFQ